MSTLLLTGWHGTLFAMMAAHTLPLMDRYSSRHGMRLCCANLCGPRPPSWMKVPHILKALETYECVVWIDTDVVIVDGSQSICDEVEDGAWQGLVEHRTTSGCVPNCGVWVCRQAMRETLASIWSGLTDIHHPWWEQAAIIEQMGYEVTDAPHAVLSRPTLLHERTTFLDQSWNDHPDDERRVMRPRFVHVTQYPDRVAEVRRLAESAE